MRMQGRRPRYRRRELEGMSIPQVSMLDSKFEDRIKQRCPPALNGRRLIVSGMASSEGSQGNVGRRYRRGLIMGSIVAGLQSCSRV